MNTQKVASAYRLSHWSQMMQRRIENRQSINEFCQTVGVSKNTYFYWQRKLREAACEQLAVRQATEVASPGFTEVRLAEIHTTAASEVCEQGQLYVEVKEVKITVDSAYPPEKLAVLLREFLLPC